MTAGTMKMAMGGLLAGLISLGSVSSAVSQARTNVGEEFTPTIWVDPDGCTHWVMDDGAEGYMSPRRNRDGSPICVRSDICGIIPSDQLFATDEHLISEANKQRLMSFFQNADAYGFLIYGHTDERASDEYNMALSDRRANTVAAVARQAGGSVVDVRGFGERQPRVAGHEAAENRRVEIYCIR